MRVFLSHSDNDAEFARELRKELKSAGLDVWDPDIKLFPGDNWLIKTGRALERADAIVFLASGEPSVWTTKEVQYVIGHQRYEGRVITVKLIPDAPTPWVLDLLVVLDGSHRNAALTARQIVRELSAPTTSQPRPVTRTRRKTALRSAKVATSRTSHRDVKLSK